MDSANNFSSYGNNADNCGRHCNRRDPARWQPSELRLPPANIIRRRHVQRPQVRLRRFKALLHETHSRHRRRDWNPNGDLHDSGFHTGHSLVPSKPHQAPEAFRSADRLQRILVLAPPACYSLRSAHCARTVPLPRP